MFTGEKSLEIESAYQHFARRTITRDPEAIVRIILISIIEGERYDILKRIRTPNEYKAMTVLTEDAHTKVNKSYRQCQIANLTRFYTQFVRFVWTHLPSLCLEVEEAAKSPPAIADRDKHSTTPPQLLMLPNLPIWQELYISCGLEFSQPFFNIAKCFMNEKHTLTPLIMAKHTYLEAQRISKENEAAEAERLKIQAQKDALAILHAAHDIEVQQAQEKVDNYASAEAEAEAQMKEHEEALALQKTKENMALEEARAKAVAESSKRFTVGIARLDGKLDMSKRELARIEELKRESQAALLELQSRTVDLTIDEPTHPPIAVLEQPTSDRLQYSPSRPWDPTGSGNPIASTSKSFIHPMKTPIPRKKRVVVSDDEEGEADDNTMNVDSDVIENADDFGQQERSEDEDIDSSEPLVESVIPLPAEHSLLQNKHVRQWAALMRQEYEKEDVRTTYMDHGSDLYIRSLSASAGFHSFGYGNASDAQLALFAQ